MELETVRAQASEEMKKHKEYVKQSLRLLKMTIQERDEARDQLHKLLNKLMIPSKTPNAEFLTTFPQLPPPESPLMKPTRANSSITESNSLSEPYNYQSQNSSPVDSFFDAVSSPELSNINNRIGDSSNNSIAFMNQPFVQDYRATIATSHAPLGIPKVDQASIIIDNLVKGKTLPQKGNLLQAVLEAGPLLQTLVVAGPLPRWRNPPPLQTFHIPPVSIKCCEAENIGQKPGGNLSHTPRPLNSQPFVGMSCGTSQMTSTSILNFGNGNSSPSVGNGRSMISAGANGNHFVPTGKRQRFH